jgi:hypothetical protein
VVGSLLTVASSASLHFGPKGAIIASSDTALDDDAFDDEWERAQENIRAKGVAVDKEGGVAMKFANTSIKALDFDEESAENLLDDIWGVVKPKTSGKAVKDDEEDSGGPGPSKRTRVTPASGSDVADPVKKRVMPALTTGINTRAGLMLAGPKGGQKQAAGQLRELNKGDTTMLEANQVLAALSTDSGVYTITVKQLASIRDKLLTRLTPELLILYSSDWQPGEASTRGVLLCEDLKGAQRSIQAVEKLVQGLQAVDGEFFVYTFLVAAMAEATAANVRVAGAVTDVVVVRSVMGAIDAEDWPLLLDLLDTSSLLSNGVKGLPDSDSVNSVRMQAVVKAVTNLMRKDAKSEVATSTPAPATTPAGEEAATRLWANGFWQSIDSFISMVVAASEVWEGLSEEVRKSLQGIKTMVGAAFWLQHISYFNNFKQILNTDKFNLLYYYTQKPKRTL